jgi:hypothetical protein
MKREDKLKEEYYKYNTTRPTHPNIAIIQTKVNALRATIEAVEVNEDDEAVKKLRENVEHEFELISYLLEEIPKTGGTEEEEEGVLAIKQKIKELDKKMRQKLDEIGYESSEDSRADLFPNGEDED